MEAFNASRGSKDTTVQELSSLFSEELQRIKSLQEAKADIQQVSHGVAGWDVDRTAPHHRLSCSTVSFFTLLRTIYAGDRVV